MAPSNRYGRLSQQLALLVRKNVAVELELDGSRLLIKGLVAKKWVA